MTTPARTALKRDIEGVRRVLNDDWNPLGVGGLPADEYDAYAWPVLRLLYEGADEMALVQHLVSIEEVYFKRSTSAATLAPVVSALRRLKLRE
jgi:hypothetical protein